MKTIQEQQNEARIVHALESINKNLSDIKEYVKVMAIKSGWDTPSRMIEDFPDDIQAILKNDGRR